MPSCGGLLSAARGGAGVYADCRAGHSMSAAAIESRPLGRAANMPELVALRNEAAARSVGSAGGCAASIEWARLSIEFRMAVLLLAGIDGDLETLARRAWLEFPTTEKQAVKVQLRAMRAQLSQLWAVLQK